MTNAVDEAMIDRSDEPQDRRKQHGAEKPLQETRATMRSAAKKVNGMCDAVSEALAAPPLGDLLTGPSGSPSSSIWALSKRRMVPRARQTSKLSRHRRQTRPQSSMINIIKLVRDGKLSAFHNGLAWKSSVSIARRPILTSSSARIIMAQRRRVEYLFVVAPDRRPTDETSGTRVRQPIPPTAFAKELRKVNEELMMIEHTPLQDRVPRGRARQV